jgi:hypothetical protein
MNQVNPLNVFKGRESMTQYFDPDLQPPLPLVELPTKLNPFRADDVRIYAKILTALPAQNVKALPGNTLVSPFGRLLLSRSYSAQHAPSPTCGSKEVDRRG